MQELGNRLWEQSRVFKAQEQMEKRTLAVLCFGILGCVGELFVCFIVLVGLFCFHAEVTRPTSAVMGGSCLALELSRAQILSLSKQTLGAEERGRAGAA